MMSYMKTPKQARRGALSLTSILAGFLLLGCETAEKETQDLEASEFDSFVAAFQGASAGVDSLKAWGIEGRRDSLMKSVLLDVLEDKESVQTWNADGTPASRDVIDVDKVIVTDDKGKVTGGLVKEYQDGIDKIDATVAEFEAAWGNASANFRDAVALRRYLRDFLARKGVQPEQVEAASEAISGAIERRFGGNK